MANSLETKEAELKIELSKLQLQWEEELKLAKEGSGRMKAIQTKKFEIDTKLKFIAEQKTWGKKNGK